MYTSIRMRSACTVAIATSLLLGLAACGNNQAPAGNGTPGQPAAATSAAKKPVPVPAAASTQVQAQAAAQARIEGMGVKELLAAGNTAINQQKLVAPKGDNAFEYYEKALEKDPKNQAAQDALREQFPFGANVVEQSIAQGNFDEAQREIALLSKADPGNYTLKILGSKLDAAQKQKQRLADQQAKQQAAQLAARQAAEAKAAAARAASAPPPAVPVQKPVVQQAQPTPVPAQVAPKSAPPPEPKPSGETRGAQVITAAQPDYPIQAARNNQSGYATVEFTVGADGTVSNVHVIGSSARVFESAAVQAVSRSKFKPALKDGQPVSSTLQRRIAFSLGG